ncbi:hypothetical protein LY76DRAFT_55763 [Colletotrichum caudatum]|nr:hypothetical protein LY76DRAFT_55763 [Colletotrichum caudatum]
MRLNDLKRCRLILETASRGGLHYQFFATCPSRLDHVACLRALRLFQRTTLLSEANSAESPAQLILRRSQRPQLFNFAHLPCLVLLQTQPCISQIRCGSVTNRVCFVVTSLFLFCLGKELR